MGKPMDSKCLSQAHFKFDKENRRWHKMERSYSVVETVDEEHVLILKGPSSAQKLDETLQKVIESVRDLAQ